ncbi:arginine decarboxylase, pyruvoyl-dependent [Anoxybacter fermentans]|uniref:Pyruvoyl-dependent arginine decarboxylase AaxB n=1 Tax=Anoxybacter fermentans TaxID=1323375 RepID=A0A3Q9HQZ6_9FIRM|nr:arginine decarboxylase, pyruvoyl-dependent [Anoxybacter fermentans]AZR73816.1 arginine decarboxylase, pyruvoyl-dependent [Anoxybacter fermentans]
MLPTPKKFTICAGTAEGASELNAFDNALLNAGIGNLNLLKVSSILPPGAEYAENLNIPPGTLTPTAYGSIVSEKPGELIAASVGIGFSENSFGVIMEYSGTCSAKEAEEQVIKMVEEAFKIRGLKLTRVMAKAVEHRVEKCGCAFAAVALWY